jgi:hypothetical protein
MNKKNKVDDNIVLKNFDYEKYQLVLPYRFLFGRKRKRFIYSELEKMHPCFSDEFCFDSDICKVSKKGFVSDVMVIHKNTLAEYETKRYESAVGINRITGSGFFIDSCKRRRFFVNEKFKRMIVTLCFVFLMIFISLVLAGVKKVAGISKKENVQAFTFVEEQNVQTSDDVEQNVAIVFRPGEKFFDSISAAGGSVLSFRWEMANGSEVLEAKIKGVFPEQFEGMKMSAVSYENEQPVILVTDIRPAPVNSLYQRSEGEVAGSFDSEFYKSVRQVLSKNGAVLKEERLTPYLIRFSCNEKVLKTLLNGVAGCFADFCGEVCSIYIQAAGGSRSVTGAGDFEISIGGEEAALERGIELAVVAENAEFFGEIKKSQLSVSQSRKQNSPVKNDGLEKSEGQKIGEIKTAEGSVIVFYKTSDGKIKKMKEE